MNIVDLLKHLITQPGVTAIRVNIADFTDLLKVHSSFPWEPVTDKDTLKTGLYGRFMHMEIHCNKMVAPESVQLKINSSDWSDSIPMNLIHLTKDLKRLSALKAFW